MLKKPWLMHKHVEVKWSRWLQVYGLDIQRCIHLSCNIFHKYMTLRNIYYARVIWMEFWNYTNNANTCNFFLFKASYYNVHVVRHLKKKMMIINWIKLYLLLLISRRKKELSVDTISMVSVSWGSASVTVNTYTAAPEAVDSGTVTVTEVPNENWGVLPVSKTNNLIPCNRK